MKRQSTILTLALVLLFAGTLGFTQDAVSEKVTVPFSSPGKPGKIEVSNQRGSITIKGYSGQEVMVVATVREKKVGEEDEVHVELGEALRERVVERAKKVAGQDQKTAGLKKIPLPGSTGLTIEEENNTMEIRTSVMRQAVDLEIQVPSTTSLELSSLMGGSITVEGVNGDIDVNNMNGRIKLAAVSGTVLAHSMSGGIEVVFKEVTQGKPMSFSTMSGDIDVTLPASTKANLKMKTDYGEIFSDFEIKIDPTPQKVSEEPQREGGRYRISFDKYYLGSINGGGPEYLFKTFQGHILIRKAK
jgi:hypothetical protein